MNETLQAILAGFGIFFLVACFIVGIGTLVWRWGMRDDGEHSPRICDAIQPTKRGPVRCTSLALPGTDHCRLHTP